MKIKKEINWYKNIFYEYAFVRKYPARNASSKKRLFTKEAFNLFI